MVLSAYLSSLTFLLSKLFNFMRKVQKFTFLLFHDLISGRLFIPSNKTSALILRLSFTSESDCGSACSGRRLWLRWRLEGGSGLYN
jgi:hypothetical protein